eukprot:scaffold386_cov174-Ochromonas_danica.AAC.50
MEDLRAKIRILEDALLFRSDEMGLAGHAGLLSKVAQLKGEVTALRNELNQKAEILQNTEKERSSITEHQVDLEEQIASLSKRLIASEQLNYRLSHGKDSMELLQKVEEERDVLLTYIQQDMAKSSSLASQIEVIESESRIKMRQFNILEEKYNELCKEHSNLEEHYQALEKNHQEMDNHYRELQYQHNLLEKEHERVKTTLQQKMKEDEDQKKMQGQVFAQMKAREEDLLTKAQDHLSLRAEMMELQHSHNILSQECGHYKAKIAKLQSENENYASQLALLQPKATRLEPLVDRLTQENNKLNEQCTSLRSELDSVRDLVSTYRVMDEDLASLSAAEDENEAIRSSSKRVTFAPENSLRSSMDGKGGLELSSLLSSTMDGQKPTQSQSPTPVSLSAKHALWIGLPSLRKHSASLYKYIRSLAMDLQSLEIAYNQLCITQANLLEETSFTIESLEKRLQQSVDLYEEEQARYTALHTSFNQLEREVQAGREAQQVLHQVHLVLQAFPAQRENLERHFRLNLDELSISQIADAVNQALLSNGESALRLQEAESQLQMLQREVQSLYASQQVNQQSLREQKALVSSLQDQLAVIEQSQNNARVSNKSNLTQAAELAEKQNMLVLTLQAKIDSVERDRQLRIAQCNTLQQREENLRTRILAQEAVFTVLPTHWQHHPPPLGDLVTFLLELKTSRHVSLVNLVSGYPPPTDESANKPSTASAPHNHSSARPYTSSSVSILGSSSLQVQSGNSLKERLKKAQQSFAAMKEGLK